SSEVTAEQVAEIARLLGVEGEPVLVDKGWGKNWRVGPDDGSAPSLWVSDDAQLSWNYSSAWADGSVTMGCAVAGSVGEGTTGSSGEPPPDDVPAVASDDVELRPVDPEMECATPEP